MFSGTIRDNIAFGKPDASQEEIESAAKAAQAHDFIMSFPDGYNTHVGERGANSLWRTKTTRRHCRVPCSLTRAFLSWMTPPPAVDLNTEAQMQKALEILMKGRTSFVIAQRISTVINADKIIVLDKGEIVAEGKHNDLMEDSPIYAEIYNSQILAFEAEHAK